MLHIGWPHPCPIRRGLEMFDSHFPRPLTLMSIVTYILCLSALGFQSFSWCPCRLFLGYIYASIPGSSLSSGHGGFPFTFPTSSTVAILQMSNPHVSPGSTSVLAGMPNILPPHLSVPFPPPLQDGDGYSEYGTMPYVPCYCRHYLSYAICRAGKCAQCARVLLTAMRVRIVWAETGLGPYYILPMPGSEPWSLFLPNWNSRTVPWCSTC